MSQSKEINWSSDRIVGGVMGKVSLGKHFIKRLEPFSIEKVSKKSKKKVLIPNLNIK